MGSSAQLNVHLSNECKFEPFKEFLRATEEKLQEQSDSLVRKDQEIGFLRSVVTKLSEKVDELDQKLDTLQDCSARTELDVVDMRRDLTELTVKIIVPTSQHCFLTNVVFFKGKH